MSPPRPLSTALIQCGLRPIARTLLSLVFELRAQGVENLPGRDGLILLVKHQRWEDVPLLGLATPRPLYYVAKHELFSRPVSRWLISTLGGIPLNRSRPLESRQSLAIILKLLEKGEGIVVFPEGTYYRGRMGPGRPGLFRMIQKRAIATFVPVGIQYTPRRARTLVRINFGRPLYQGPHQRGEGLFRALMKEMARLSGF